MRSYGELPHGLGSNISYLLAPGRAVVRWLRIYAEVHWQGELRQYGHHVPILGLFERTKVRNTIYGALWTTADHLSSVMVAKLWGEAHV